MGAIVPDFLEEVYNASIPRETKADVVEYYKQKYPGLGRGGWKQHLIADLLSASDVTPGSVGAEEYKRLVKNMSKRFDPQRLNNPEPRNADQYKEFAKDLPPMAPEGGYHIEGTIYVKYSDECVERYIEEDITGNDAQELVGLAAKEMLQGLFNYYQTEDLEGKGPGLGDCDEPELTVTAIE